MGKRRGNSRWSEGLAPEVTNTPSEFEQVTARLRLQPNQYTDSASVGREELATGVRSRELAEGHASERVGTARGVGPCWHVAG
jgi:hypothetical protein